MKSSQLRIVPFPVSLQSRNGGRQEQKCIWIIIEGGITGTFGEVQNKSHGGGRGA